jgi:hypothetical protein
MSKADRFGGTKTAKINEKGEYLQPGDYELEIKRCILLTARDKSEYYIVDFDVVTAAKNGQRKKIKKVVDGREVETDGEEYVPSPVGAKRNWMQAMGTDMTDSNLKGFIVAALGVDASDTVSVKAIEDDLPEALAASLDDPTDKECTNMLKGKRIKCSVKIIQTKAKKEDFSLHTWGPAKSA